jgi:3-methylfumaryl-CoA hydratase
MTDSGRPDWRQWIGRTREGEDVVTAGLIEGLRATLDSTGRHGADEPAPQGLHWLLAPVRAPMHALGPDGHARTGDFLPPMTLPRRMWAASDIQFLSPIPVGAPVRLRSEIVSITPKSGASGELVFVDVDHVIVANGTPAVRERQTIVYRAAAGGSARAEPDQGSHDFERRCRPDPVMLFRYSALTFNGHRIHYDQPYATGVEGYPGLVVHGPLTATLLIDLCARQFGGNRLARFSFRAVSPAFAARSSVSRPRRYRRHRPRCRLGRPHHHAGECRTRLRSTQPKFRWHPKPAVLRFGSHAGRYGRRSGNRLCYPFRGQATLTVSAMKKTTSSQKSKPPRLAALDMSLQLPEDVYLRELADIQQRLRRIQQAYLKSGDSAALVFEGWDAAGKGGTIRCMSAGARSPRLQGLADLGPPKVLSRPALPGALFRAAAAARRHFRLRPILVRAGSGRAGRVAGKPKGLAAGLPRAQ